MVLAPEPVFRAVEAASPPRPLYLLGPGGRRFDQRWAAELAAAGGFSLLCGRYEGVDQRVADHLADGELSIGDFVLGGGEVAALAVIEDEGLVENAARRGAELMRGLEALQAKYDLIADVRGRGLIIGIEFGRPSGMKARAGWAMLQKARVGLFAQMVVVALFQRHRILTQVSGDHMEVIKLIPPLMIGDAEVKLFIDGLADVLEDASKGSGLMWDFGRTLIKSAVRS